jgi:hypothetical protein
MEKGNLKEEIPTVEQVLMKVRGEEGYSINNNLYPKLMELALARHMEKVNKVECQPDKCKEYSEEMRLVINELREILKDEEERNTL